MLKVDEIQNGVVIDHITAGTGLALYHMMELEKLNNASVALLQNVRSQKDGKKDIIKIEGDVSEMSFDVLAYVDPKISITFIRDGRVTEKKHPEQPKRLAGIADRLLVELEQRAARQGYTLHHTPAAAKVLAGDKVPPYGARELRRTVSRAVEQALADRIAAGTAHPGTVYTADVDADGHIILTEDTLAACV